MPQEFDLAKVGPVVAVAIILVVSVMVAVGSTIINNATNAFDAATPGTYTTGENVTNIEIFDDQMPFGEPTATWYSFNNDPWSQSIDYPLVDCNGGNMSQVYFDYTGHGNYAFGDYNLVHDGTDYISIDFHINTTPVTADDLYYWEDFQNESPATEGDTTPSPYDDTYEYEESAAIGVLNLSSGFNATYQPSDETTNMVWWINNTGAGADVTEWFNDTSSVNRIYEIGFDFNVTDFNSGLMDVNIGYPNYFNTTFGFQTNPNGYDYLLWENDDVVMTKNLSEFPLTGTDIWYTARFYFDAYDGTVNCTIWDTATTTELYWMDTYDITAMPIYGDLLFTAYDDGSYGDTSIKIDNYYVMGYDDVLLSNAFKVVPFGTGDLMVIDNVNDTAFDVTMWNGTTSSLIYAGLNTGEWYHYFMVFNWDNGTIETTARRSSDNAWMGSTWIGMSDATPDLSRVMFSGIDTFDCDNYVDNITTSYDNLVVHQGDDTSHGVYENIKTQSGNALGLALIIIIAIAAVVIILVILVLPRMLGRE